jgi:Fe-S-cluster containining protein
MTEPAEPWYSGGLRFTCTECGNCCSGAPGYVWVNRDEIAALAARLNMTPEAFQRQYTRRVGLRRSLIENLNYDCVFLDAETRRCRVYEQRPRQCRSWPFWDSNLRSPEAWKSTCQVCPGSGRGKLYSLDVIEDHRPLCCAERQHRAGQYLVPSGGNAKSAAIERRSALLGCGRRQ